VLQPHGHANQALADAGGLPLRLGEPAVRRGCGMGDGGFGVAQIGRDAADLGAVDHMKSVFAGAFHVSALELKRQHRAAAALLFEALLPHRQRVLRVRLQTGVKHACHGGLRFQPRGQRQRVGALRLHADGERLQALEHHPGIEGRQRHAGTAHDGGEFFVDEFFRPANRAGNHPALAVKVFGA